MDEDILNIFPHPGFQEPAKAFHEAYDLVTIIMNGEERYTKRKLRPYTTRTCLFCGKSYPDALFAASKYAHLVPKLIGNTKMYSDFECHDCNQEIAQQKSHQKAKMIDSMSWSSWVLVVLLVT